MSTKKSIKLDKLREEKAVLKAELMKLNCSKKVAEAVAKNKNKEIDKIYDKLSKECDDKVCKLEVEIEKINEDTYKLEDKINDERNVVWDPVYEIEDKINKIEDKIYKVDSKIESAKVSSGSCLTREQALKLVEKIYSNR